MTGTSCYRFGYHLHLIKIPLHVDRESIYRRCKLIIKANCLEGTVALTPWYEVAEWIITVGHRSNSEPNLPRAEQFDERADIVAGLPASEMKDAIKRRAWPMCSSDCEVRSMATKRQRVSTRSSDSSVANKKKRRQVSVATVTVMAALHDGRARSIVTADCTSV